MGHNDSRHEDRRGGWRDGLRATVDVGVRAAGARQLRAVLINAAILTLALAGFAVAQNADGGGKAHSAASRRAGDAVELGRRNPSSGSVPAETAIVANSGNSGFALRLTNNAPGGRANSSTCTNDATDPTAGCHVYVNKGKGIVASFRSAGSGVAPFAVRNTNDGMVASLNSQFVNNNQVACPSGTQLVAGICAETALRQRRARCPAGTSDLVVVDELAVEARRLVPVAGVPRREHIRPHPRRYGTRPRCPCPCSRQRGSRPWGRSRSFGWTSDIRRGRRARCSSSAS